jgi:hypothetical protein
MRLTALFTSARLYQDERVLDVGGGKSERREAPSGLKVSRLTALSAQFSTRSTKFLMALKMFQFLALHLGLSSDATHKGTADNQLSTVRARFLQFLLLQEERLPATHINFVATVRILFHT